MMPLPFRVLELAGPATAPCGHLLAVAGADVIKVAPPSHAGDGSRCPDPGDRHPRETEMFFDTGKRSITLDITVPAGRELFVRIASRADVVLEGFAPGVLAELGLSYAVLRSVHPGLVLASITPFGQTGPYSRFRATDLVVFAMGGVMFISGEPGRPPVVAPDQQSYALAGAHAAFAVLAALWERWQTGRGDWVDVSMFECWVAQENTITNYHGPGQFARRRGSQHRTSLPGRIFPCRDGFIHIFISREAAVWKRFLAWMGNPPELADEALADINARWRHADLVNRVTAEFTRRHTRAELFESAQAMRLPCVPVNEPAEFLCDAQTVAADPVLTLSHPLRGTYRTLRIPAGASALRPAPCPGEHNDEVYRDLARVGPEQLRAYREAHVV
jgi:crotonobetainyl-CoA:carnitine CoA-transferase CaiB-like acyl-CoA transferase